ncbi:hypothetical protein [Kocuria nitroreducens]|uniref:hypothetical protein n=1 Tax=Kocuria nitroreducens TaxID=3058914 RepID=UPI0036DF13D5
MITVTEQPENDSPQEPTEAEALCSDGNPRKPADVLDPVPLRAAPSRQRVVAAEHAKGRP